MLDKNTVKLVAAEYDLLVVDKEEVGITAGAVKTKDFMELEDMDEAVGGLRHAHTGAVCTTGVNFLAMRTFRKEIGISPLLTPSHMP